MSNLQKHIAFVKEQAAFQARMAVRFAENPYRVKLHREAQEKFASLAADLEAASKTLDIGAPSTPRPNGVPRLNLLPEEIQGLPEDVFNELSISEGDLAEFAILSLIEGAGGMMSLDQLIVGLFRKGEKIKRQTLTSKLYRMAQKELVFSVPTKKGVYSTRPISEEEATTLFS